MDTKKKVNVLQARISAENRDEFIKKTQNFLSDEYEIDIGEFDVEEILTFFCESIASVFYNQGVADARKLLDSRFIEISEDIGQLEIID